MPSKRQGPLTRALVQAKTSPAKAGMRWSTLVFVAALLYAATIVMFNHYYRIKSRYFQISSSKQAVDDIHAYVDETYNRTRDMSQSTMHFWNEDIPSELRASMDLINAEIMGRLGAGYAYVPPMTELYFSSKANRNSDRQFEYPHMDGPFYACRLYRVLVVINGNANVDTHLHDEGKMYNLRKYDVLLFDYNNTPHFVDANDKELDTSQRVLLKFHYMKKSDMALCGENLCKFSRKTRANFERNKGELHLSGIVSITGLHYNTHRAYVVLIAAVVFLYYLSTCSKVAFAALTLFVAMEIIGIGYMLHYNLLQVAQCT